MSSTKVLMLNNPQTQEITQFISSTLACKAKKELIAHDMNHKTMFGNTNFWFHLEESGQLILIYDRHPSEWDVEGIMETIYSYERIHLTAKGVPFY